MYDLDQIAKELSEFLGVPFKEAVERVGSGFHANHAAVAEDFRRVSPRSDDELLEWYMTTTAYIYAELPAYHLDTGFNYSGMMAGIREKLLSEGKNDILVLGDGIGDLTMTLRQAGLNAIYHDLEGSRTAEFAQFRFNQNLPLELRTLSPGVAPVLWTDGWNPDLGIRRWDAIVALDFMEHLINVEDWVRAAWTALRTGGYLMAQNAFAIGDDEHGGSIPMHLTINNRFEHDWIPLLQESGFVHQVSEWWQKK